VGRKQNKRAESGHRRLLLAVLVLAILVALAYSLSRNSTRRLARIRELGQQDPAAAIKWLEESDDRSEDGQLLRCQLLALAGRWKQAEEAFEAVVQPELCGRNELIDLATIALGSGVYSLADEVLDAAYRQGNRHAQLLHTMIDVKFQLGDNQEALRLCHELSELAPHDPYPLLLSAQIYHRAEKIDLAMEAYRETLQRDPDARGARIQLADLAIYAGDLDTARHQLDRLAGELSDSPDVGVLLAKLLHREGKPDACLRVLDRVLAAKPNTLPALLERGVLHLERENFADAIGDLKQVVTLAPENYTGHYKLGLAYQRLNQPDIAKRHLERSIQITDHWSKRKLQEWRSSNSRTPTR
jgi:Flp pilus assembly protein TadD